jgi:anion-transporting  ArsA/GET3 family ATPase
MEQNDLNQIERIEIILPMRENAVIEDKNITIVDMPGIEDALCLKKMLTYIEDNRFKIVPMFVIDMT